MRVGLAVQVFSNSVAHGMEVYKRKVEELKDSESTVDFCCWINRTFDALNRTEDLSGVTLDSLDCKIIQNSLKRLDDWGHLLNLEKYPQWFSYKTNCRGITSYSSLHLGFNRVSN
ncbi:uncharacterized protein [Fopius arisanus]|uniref:Uncharacterized protein isoform X1 n=1 Tax=Fopius arisanus TaxID=64838 RepID=A0A9R1U0M1_9HYME|nr:PREDICTED: uncharacterized protein LOC105266445 isoform X1 [Fopius arisanus]